jgi:hypothetical protein
MDSFAMIGRRFAKKSWTWTSHLSNSNSPFVTSGRIRPIRRAVEQIILPHARHVCAWVFCWNLRNVTLTFLSSLRSTHLTPTEILSAEHSFYLFKFLKIYVCILCLQDQEGLKAPIGKQHIVWIVYAKVVMVNIAVVGNLKPTCRYQMFSGCISLYQYVPTV